MKVDAQVTDKSGRTVPGLTAADFQIFDDDRPQTIIYFGEESEPLDLVLLLDVSGSMHRHLAQLSLTARAALRQLDAADRTALMLFARRAEIRAPLKADFRSVEQALLNADGTSLGSGTAINAAIVAAAQYLQKQPARGRRAILIVTDNLSLNYLVPDEEVMRQLYAADAVLNGILIGKQKRPDPPRPGQFVNPDFTPSHIFKLAEQSGGAAMEVGKIGDSFARMIERIRARYSLQYEAPQSDQDAFHRIRVELTQDAGLRFHHPAIRARAGYFAAN